MITIETHGRTGLSHLFKDSIAEYLANHTVIPMFSVKIEKEREALTNVVTDFLADKI
jgi:hypothetical protein